MVKVKHKDRTATTSRRGTIRVARHAQDRDKLVRVTFITTSLAMLVISRVT